MKPQSIKTSPLACSRAIAALGILAGFAVAVDSALPSHGYFLENFAFTWLPQVAVLGILLWLRSPPAMLGGVALALALHLGAFSLWISSSADVTGWLFYFFDFPGALIGAGIARYRLLLKAPTHPAVMALQGFGWVTVGLLVSLTPVWLHL